MKLVQQIALVELDLLLDTRMGTVHSLNEDAPWILIQEGYRTRKADNMEMLSKGLVKQQAYLDRYASRDFEVLSNSRPTEFLFELRAIILRCAFLEQFNPMVNKVNLKINIFPYHLTETEQEKLIALVKYYLQVPCEVETVRLSPRECGPAYLKSNIGAFFLYDFARWTEINAEALTKYRIPNIEVIAPALYRDTVPETDILALNDNPNNTTDFFTYTETYLAGLVKVSFIDVKYGSVIDLDVRDAEHIDPSTGS